MQKKLTFSPVLLPAKTSISTLSCRFHLVQTAAELRARSYTFCKSLFFHIFGQNDLKCFQNFRSCFFKGFCTSVANFCESGDAVWNSRESRKIRLNFNSFIKKFWWLILWPLEGLILFLNLRMGFLCVCLLSKDKQYLTIVMVWSESLPVNYLLKDQ